MARISERPHERRTALEHMGYVDLPAHTKPGGFDHAAVHGGRGLLYVAHTANDAVDVIDCATNMYLRSIPHLTGVAGALVSETNDLVFTSNRGEDTVGIFSPSREETVAKVKVGVGPNGLAYGAAQRLLLAANVGDPSRRGSFTVSLVDISRAALIANVPVPGRTRWTVFDQESGRFYVNIMDPPQIVVVDTADPTRLADTFPMPAMGPHGLDLDPPTRRLFCACDGQVLLVVDSRSGAVQGAHALSGVPDVVFLNAALRHLYVAIGDPGVIDVFDTETMRRLESVPTERGAHTIGFDAVRNTVYAFLPDTHRAAVYRDQPG
jgi:DNA-binding beta-propeller fold protein YncE